MELLECAPRFGLDRIASIVKELYGLDGTLKELPSERDQNTKITDTSSGATYVFKIANSQESRGFLEAQNEALNCIAKTPSSNLCQRVIPALNGETIAQVTSSQGVVYFVRLMSFISGIPMGSIERHSPDLLQDLGGAVASIDKSLLDFNHPAINRFFHWDFAHGVDVCKQYKHLISDKNMLNLVERLLISFEATAAPRLSELRKSVIHNDAHTYNVLVGGGNDIYSRNQRVVGIIDFGDMIHGYTVGGLAIAVAYAMLGKADPFQTAVHLVKGYHQVLPLEEKEIGVLYYLVILRLCMSVCIGAWQQSQRPDDPYLSISKRPVYQILPKLAAIHPRLAEATFRHAVGLEPVKNSTSVVNYLKSHSLEFVPVLRKELMDSNCVVLDLSAASTIISSDENLNTPEIFEQKLADIQAKAGAKFSVGRYDEPRLIYTSSLFGAADAGENRTIHLGIDLFCAAGNPIYAPLEGEVHICTYNPAPLDYGYLVILKHKTPDNCEFFTLYGHLGKESLDNLEHGQKIQTGEQVGIVGKPHENGGWSPHLHFQIIVDLLDVGCDFPGVAKVCLREVFKSLSPDPNLILKIPLRYFPAATPSKQQTLLQRKSRIGPSLTISYRNPVKAVRGWKQFLYDETGRRYIDCYNNVPHVGHCHPRVVAALCDQASVLNTNTRYLHDKITDFAEALCATLPPALTTCFFVNSGSEANELALRLAKTYTKRNQIIVLENAYHGNTNTLVEISPYKTEGPGGEGAPDWVHSVPIPDGYRGPHKYVDDNAGPKYAAGVADLIAELVRQGKLPAAFICESLPSVGGQIVLPKGYLHSVYSHVREAGGVCIADEVQTAYGRIGTHFYGFQSQDVVPDIVVLGKPIGNGHPIGAVVTTAEIAEAFNNGMEFFSTFGGNTVSCAVGLEVLKVVHEEKLQQHALSVGIFLLDGLRDLAKKYPIIGDVRGSGLFLGAELVKDPQTLEPATEEASFIANEMRERGILLGTDGPFHNVLKIRPPMVFNVEDAQFFIQTLDAIMQENFGNHE